MPINGSNILEIMVDHYQKSYELTNEFWKQRNNTFLLLLGTIAIGTLITFGGVETNSILVELIAKSLSITDVTRINEIRSSFPFSLLQSILLIVVFYLMVNLYHRAIFVLKNFKYLALLEKEIRENLGISNDKYFFSREGLFYWSERPKLLSITKWFYIILLGGLLLTFLIGRVLDDIEIANYFLASIDGFLSLFILVYFGGYAIQSVKLDSKKNIYFSQKEE